MLALTGTSTLTRSWGGFRRDAGLQLREEHPQAVASIVWQFHSISFRLSLHNLPLHIQRSKHITLRTRTPCSPVHISVGRIPKGSRTFGTNKRSFHFMKMLSLGLNPNEHPVEPPVLLHLPSFSFLFYPHSIPVYMTTPELLAIRCSSC